MNSAVENSAVEHTEAEEDSESPLAKRAKTSSRDDTLPPALEGLTEKDYKRIISEEVVLDKDHSAHGYEKGETYSMAMAVASKDGDQPAIDISKLHLSKLHLSKLRKLAKNFGIKMISKMPSAVIRIHLARNAHIGSILDNATKIKSPPSHAKRMQNTIVRLVNVIFSHGFIQGLMKWNNHRKRADHETGVGGTMDRFFVQVHTAMYAIDEDDGGEEKIPDVADREDDRSIHSFDAGDAPDDSLELEHVNLVLERTTNDNDPYASLSRFEERTDLDHEKVGLYFELADPDPGQYMKLPSKMLRGWTGDLLRARKKLIENMKRLKGDSTSLDVGKDDDFSAMTGGNDTTVTKQGESMERMANYFELIQQSTSIAAAAATAASHEQQKTKQEQQKTNQEQRLISQETRQETRKINEQQHRAQQHQ